jgi:TrmH family RNA methyltransferase
MSARLRVVLVDPENPLNVGFVARAMKCFGAEELVVAASTRWDAMPEKAGVTGEAALDVLQAARFVPTLEEALKGCATAVAFSRRPSALRREEVELPSAPSLQGKAALVFGRESAGLTVEESALCPTLARIPMREGLSLNLGQAVAVALFAWSPQAGAKSRGKAVPAAALDRMLDLWHFLEPRLSAAPRFTPQRLRRIRQLLYRLKLDDEELDLLFGVVNELSRPAAERKGRR